MNNTFYFNLDFETKECVLRIFDNKLNFIFFDSNVKMLPVKVNKKNSSIQTFKPNYYSPCYVLELDKSANWVILYKVEKILYLKQEIICKVIEKKTFEEAEKMVVEFLEDGIRKREILFNEIITLKDIISSYINELLV